MRSGARVQRYLQCTERGIVPTGSIRIRREGMRGCCVAWGDSGIMAKAAAPTASSASRAAMSRYLPIERRLPAIAASQPATNAPPRRGRRRTSSPTPISVTPTSRMKVRPSTGSRRSTLGLKYRSQSTSRLVNLSAPATIGTRPYPIRNSVFASDGMLVPPTGKLRLRRVRGSPEAGALLLRHRDPQLYAAIFRPASWRVVRRDGLSLAHPDGQRPLLRDAAVHQYPAHRLRAADHRPGRGACAGAHLRTRVLARAGAGDQRQHRSHDRGFHARKTED